MPELDSEAIDFGAASELYSEHRRLRRSDMETLRLMTRHQGRRVPTIGGVLLFGVKRLDSFPDAWIQAGRFRGNDKARIVDRVQIRSPLPRAIEEGIAFVTKHSLFGAEIGAVRRRDRWTHPIEAVREAVVNAVAHADYSQRGAPIRISFFDDRLEVDSPGMLPAGLTVEDLRRGVSKLRNRVIGRVLHDLGLIEQWGSGIQRMTRACVEAGLSEPLLEELGTCFRVTIFSTRVGDTQVDETERAILRALAESDGLSTKEIATAVGRSARSTRTRLIKLIERGLVRAVGSGPRDPRRKYFLLE